MNPSSPGAPQKDPRLSDAVRRLSILRLAPVGEQGPVGYPLPFGVLSTSHVSLIFVRYVVPPAVSFAVAWLPLTTVEVILISCNFFFAASGTERNSRVSAAGQSCTAPFARRSSSAWASAV